MIDHAIGTAWTVAALIASMRVQRRRAWGALRDARHSPQRASGPRPQTVGLSSVTNRSAKRYMNWRAPYRWRPCPRYPKPGADSSSRQTRHINVTDNQGEILPRNSDFLDAQWIPQGNACGFGCAELGRDCGTAGYGAHADAVRARPCCCAGSCRVQAWRRRWDQGRSARGLRGCDFMAVPTEIRDGRPGSGAAWYRLLPG